MAKLPLFSKEKKEVLHNIYCLGWMVNMQKVISEADDDKKETYQKWAEYESNIKNYTKKQFLVKSQIYTKFNTTFSEATKFQDIFNKKTKTSRVKLDEVDKVSKEMDECLVDLSQEITTLRDSVPTFKELQESLKSLEGTKPEITAYTDLLRQFRDSYFHISEEETVILKVKKAYEENKKRVKNFLIILMTKNSDRRIELSKIESLIEQYQDLKVVFAEGEKVIEEKEINHKLFKEIEENLENSEELEYDKIIELEEKFKNMKIRFEGEEKLLKTIEKVKPRSFLNQFARWKKEKGEIVNQYSVMEAQKLYKDSDGDQNMDTEDHPALTDLEKYIEAKIDAINAFEDYIVCKEDMEKSHSNDPINYDVYYNLRLKDLKGSKLRELAKKRQVKKKEKDEEDLKNMNPEEYRRMKKRERLKRQNKNKTDVFVDKGNDEDWDARCIKYAEPDIKIEDDATEESNSQQETPKKPTAVKKNIKSSKKLILNKNSKKSIKKEPKKITKKAAAKQPEAKPAKKIVKKDLKELIKGSAKPDKKEKIDVKAKFLQKMKDSKNKNMELISKLKKAKSTQESSKTSQTKCETPSPKNSKKVTENKDDGIKEESEEESKDESEDESEDKSEDKSEEEKPKKIVKKKTIPKGKQPAKPAKATSKTAKKPKKTAVKATKEDPPEKTVSSSKFGIKKGKFSLSSKVKPKAKTSILSGKKRKLGGLAASLNKINKS